MRRNYITPEYTYTNVNGTLNMVEQKGIFGSKLINIEDMILLDNKDIVYYQNSLNEQIDILQESLLSPIIYSISDDKNDKHTLLIDEAQSEFEKKKNTKWILEINIQDILVNYIFSRIKEYRAFENVKNSATSFNNVNTAIRKYIEFNLLSRYNYKSITLYIKYNSLKDSGFLRHQNIWDTNINQKENIHSKIEIELNSDKSKLICMFTQEQVATSANFSYYFDINYERI